MRKRLIESLAVVVCLVGLGQGSSAVAAVKKLTDLTCTAEQTVFFDGTFWACVDFGVTGLQRIQADFPPNDGQLSTIATQQVSAACPSGKKVVGGGYLFFYGGPTVPIRTNAPTVPLNAWLVSGTNPDNTPWRLSAIAICADAP
jgi:hypothetical protein